MAKFIENMDAKMSPAAGNTLRKVFMWITMILIFVGLPLFAFAFGSVALIGTSVALAGLITTIVYIVLVAISWTLWFYFSKWSEK